MANVLARNKNNHLFCNCKKTLEKIKFDALLIPIYTCPVHIANVYTFPSCADKYMYVYSPL